MKNKKYKYYTPYGLSEALIELLTDIEPQTAIDICCGSWNLLLAAKKKFTNIKITGVDVDGDSEKIQPENSDFYQQDGREYAIRCFNHGIGYNLILANPPFGFLPKEKRLFTNGEYGNYCSLVKGRYEIEMLIANILLIQENSNIVAILPQTFFTGESNKDLRKNIANEFSIKYIIDLPKNTFHRGNIKTCAIVMTKVAPNSIHSAKYCIASLKTETWNIKIDHTITTDVLISGDWLVETVKHTADRNSTVLSYRGNISSNCFSKMQTGRKVLHSSRYNGGIWSPTLRSVPKSILETRMLKYAEKGDIIINRIGKSAGYWCTYQGRKILVSDCLIVIKTDNDLRIQELLQRFSNEYGQLHTLVKGVSTPYVSMSDVLNVIQT